MTIEARRISVTIRCMACHRSVQLRVDPNQRLRVRCSRCGSRDAVIERDRMQAWARKRRGR